MASQPDTGSRALLDTTPVPDPEIRTDPLASERYVSPEFMRLEWEHMWTRVWNIAGLESELADPGRFLTCRLGPESLLFCRGEDGELRGYYNVCQHRGNLLVQKETGRARSFPCPYHGWVWSHEGELLSVQDPEDFRRDPCGRLTLVPVRTETRAGFVWFNLDPDAVSLADFLDPVVEQLETYPIEKMVRTHHITLEADCNWKVIQDNFQESYHIPTVHPALKYFLDDTYQNTQFDLYETGHNRMLMLGGGPSPRAAGEDETVLRFMRPELEFWELDPDEFRGRTHEMRGALQAQKRRLGASKGFDFSGYIDAQLTDHYHYTLFPNVSLSMKPDGCIFLRGTPHPTDPQKSFFDCWYLALFPDGRDEYHAFSMAAPIRRDAKVEHQTGRLGDVFLGGGIDQDASVFVSQQQGLRSRGYGGATLSGQERRVQYYHQVIDEYIAGVR